MWQWLPVLIHVHLQLSFRWQLWHWDPFCSLNATLSRMPLIQLHHAWETGLVTTPTPAQGCLGAGDGVLEGSEGAHRPAQSLTPTETQRHASAIANPPALGMKANNHCASRGSVGFSEALGGCHSVLACSRIRTFTAKVGNFQDMQKNKLSGYFLPHRFLKRVTKL